MHRSNGYRSAYNGTKDFTDNTYETQASGFNSTATDYTTSNIDLNEQLIGNKAETFFFRMNSNTMSGAGIFKGDILIVDRSVTETNGKVVIAVLDGEMIVRRLESSTNRIRLIPATPNLSAIDIDPFANFAVWGVVVYAIHAV